MRQRKRCRARLTVPAVQMPPRLMPAGLTPQPAASWALEMARIRTIKPEFWTHEGLSALPEATHMLAAALLNYADDEGYFNANPGLIMAACSPIREPSVRIPESLRSLHAEGYLMLGVGPDGRRYGRIIHFADHQKISHPTPSKISAISITWEDSGKLPEDSVNPPEPLRPDWNREQGTGNGKEQGTGNLSPIISGSLTLTGQSKAVARRVNGEARQAPATGKAWAAYSTAYLARYKTEPVRNAKVNGQLAQLAKRLPEDEVEHVIRWYVASNANFYVRSKHSVDLLLRDCEGLRTEWATGARMTDTEARQIDQHDAGMEAARWVTEHKEQLRQMRREGKI